MTSIFSVAFIGLFEANLQAGLLTRNGISAWLSVKSFSEFGAWCLRETVRILTSNAGPRQMFCCKSTLSPPLIWKADYKDRCEADFVDCPEGIAIGSVLSPCLSLCISIRFPRYVILTIAPTTRGAHRVRFSSKLQDARLLQLLQVSYP